MLSQLVIATSNPAKFQEISNGLKILKNKGVKIFSLKDLKIKEKPEETGKTFKENALIKAEFYGKLTKMPVIADDGGLIIPFLNNEPGVKSRRWLGYEADDEELINFTLKKLENTKPKDRRAYLKTCVVFYYPEKKLLFTQTEKISGWIAQKTSKKRIAGYPFRALFVVKKFNKYYDELTKKEHQEINHRLKALKKIVEKIIKNKKLWI